MSDDRQTLNIPAVDQGTRGDQAVVDDQETVPTEDDVIEGLRKQLHDLEERDRRREVEVAEERKRVAEERRRRESAEFQARDANARAIQATTVGQRTAEEARLEQINTALEASKAQMESLRAQYQAAFSEGAGDKMASINADMSLLGARIVSLDAGKAQLEQRKAAADAAPPQPQTRSRDELLSGMNQRERDWANAHPEYFTDPSFQQRVAAAANYASNIKGLSRESDEYIIFVNQELGLSESAPPAPLPRQERDTPAAPTGRTPDGAAGAAPSTSSSDRRMVAAPVGGSVPNTGGRGDAGDGAIYLTREEKEMARIQGVPEQEYARHKRDLQREGLIGSGARNRG